MSAADTKLKAYLESTIKLLDAKPVDVLKKIDKDDRRLLAVRGYLKSEDVLDEQWTWSEEEVKRQQDTATYKKAIRQAEDVKSTFARQNAGYTLVYNRKPRSLAEQLKNWNRAGSKRVREAAALLWKNALLEIADTTYPDTPDEAALKRFKKYVRRYDFPRGKSPSYATPGLSDHGQFRAIDFKVFDKGKDEVIAGTSTATTQTQWDQPGWTEKLKSAVEDAKADFEGPLQSPYEPWHYTIHAE